MQTLAGHTFRSSDWVDLMASVDGLISLAASHCVPYDEGCVPHANALLRALHEVNETMRQCEEVSVRSGFFQPARASCRGASTPP